MSNEYLHGMFEYVFLPLIPTNSKLNLQSGNESCSVMSNTLKSHGLNSPGQNTGVGSLSLLQGIFQTQGSNLGLPHCRGILYQLRHKGSPRTLDWVAHHFSSRSSCPRNQTRVSCIAGRFFTSWAMREALLAQWLWANHTTSLSHDSI